MYQTTARHQNLIFHVEWMNSMFVESAFRKTGALLGTSGDGYDISIDEDSYPNDVPAVGIAPSVRIVPTLIVLVVGRDI